MAKIGAGKRFRHPNLTPSNPRSHAEFKDLRDRLDADENLALDRTRREVVLQRMLRGTERTPKGCFTPGRSGNPSGKRKGCLPRQIYPKNLEASYAAELVKIIRRLRDAYLHVLRQAPVLAQSAVALRTDAGEGRQARDLLEQARRMAAGVIGQTELEALAVKFANRTGAYQKEQLNRQVRAALGVDVFLRDEKLSALADDWIVHNVSLIKRIPERLHTEIESMVQQSVTSGVLNDDLADDIEERFGVSESHARLIARDQISKFYGDTNAARQKELGITRFIWRTVNDERVRSSHAEFDGNEYSYDDLPVNERGERIKPGDDFSCRCYSEPVFDELLAVDDATV